MPRYALSDHCDGVRFINPGAVDEHRSPADLLRWWRTRQVTPWPDRLPAVPARAPSPPPDGAIAVTWIGHSTMLLQAGNGVILTDPVFTSHAGPYGRFGPRRVCPPALPIAALPRVTLVAVSHNHYDHLQPSNLLDIQARFAPAFVTTLGNRAFLERRGLRRVTEMDWWDETSIDDVRIACTPARHFSARTPFDRNRTLWGGFVFDAGGRRIYFAGDSGYGDHFREIGRRVSGIDLACLPIGAYDPRWFMRPVHADPEEALQAHLDVGAGTSVGMHFGTFRLTDEPFDEPGARLARARTDAGLPPTSFIVPRLGETIVV